MPCMRWCHGGVAFGTAATVVAATTNGWITEVPPVALSAGLVAALVVGAMAGLYPALQAARLAPT